MEVFGRETGRKGKGSLPRSTGICWMKSGEKRARTTWERKAVLMD